MVWQKVLFASTALSAAWLAATTVAAQEGGVRLVFGLEQRFDYGSNLALSVPAEGSSTVSSTRLSFGLTSQTPLDLLQFSASSALLVENTPTTSGTELSLGRPDLSFSYTREVPNAIFSVRGNYRSDDVRAFDREITDTSSDGIRTDYGLGLRFETGRTDPLSFALDAAYDRTEYQGTTDPDLTDLESYAIGLQSRLRFSDTISAVADVRFLREKDADLGQTMTDTATATIGLDYRVSERLTLGAAVGATRIDVTEFGVLDRTSGPIGRLGLTLAMPNGTADAVLTLARERGEGGRTTLEFGRALDLPAGTLSARLGVTRAESGPTDVIGAIAWTHVLPDGRATVSLERAVSYDFDAGDAVVATTFAADWSHDINSVSSLALDFSYDFSDAPSELIRQAEVGATYRYALTPDWSLSGGVRYRQRRDLAGRADSPSLFIALGRSFEVRP